jgi:hypothetical protein
MIQVSSGLPDEWLIELGRLTDAWPALEATLDLMIQKLAKFETMFDPTFRILVAHSSFPQRLDMLASLCNQLVDQFSHLNDYKAVIAKLRDVQTTRNKFTHNAIGRGYGGDENRFGMIYVSSRGKLRQEIIPIELEELKAATTKIRDAIKAVYQLVLQPERQ